MFSCGADKKENDLTKVNLFGNVKSVRIKSYDALEKFGEYTKGEFYYKLNTFWEYNINGDLTKKSSTNQDGIVKENIYLYDDRGNQIESGFKLLDGSFSFKEKFKYNDKGHVIEHIYDSEGIFQHNYSYKSKYDNNGNIIESAKYNDELRLSFKEKYKYDNNGNITDSAKYYDDGTLWIQQIYNDGGNIIEIVNYSPIGTVNSKQKFQYDNKGSMIEKKYYKRDGSLTGNYKYEYDNSGNIVKEIIASPKRSIKSKTYKYEFDKQGNWIKQVNFRDEKATIIVEREIVYY
jgi:hypothetical protein